MSCAQRGVENILRLGHFTYWEVRPDSPPFIIYLPRGITGRNSEIISNPISFYLLTERQTTNRNKDRDSILLNKDKPNLKKKIPPPIPVERMPQPLNWRKLSKSCLRRSSTMETTFNLENWQFASLNFLQSFRNPNSFAKKTLEAAAIEHVRECKGFLGELHLWPFEPSQSHQRAFNVLLQALGRDRA